MRSRQRLWIIFAVIAAIGGLILPMFCPTTRKPSFRRRPATRRRSRRALLSDGLPIAERVGCDSRVLHRRKSVPAYRAAGWHWTVGTYFIAICNCIVYGIAVEIGFFLLFVPGFFLAIKWSQVVWCYLLSEGKNPFGESWEITKGMFWRTFLFLLVLWLVLVVLLVVTYGISAEASPPSCRSSG